MKTVYIANDGTEFNDETSCIRYEKEYEKKALENYYGIPHVHFTYDDILIGASDEFGYDVLYIRNETDVDTLNKVFALKRNCFSDNIIFDNSYIGKNIIFGTDFEDTLYYDSFESTFESFKANIENRLNSIADEVKALHN